MHKAYDCVLQTIITAEDAVINRGFEPYRYECLCCGEEVRLAAPFSEQRAPHFRHLSGNNDTECEEYFGLGEARLSKRGERRGHREVAEIFYSNVKKAFMLKIKFAEEELHHYETLNASLTIKTAANKTPFKSVLINKTNFVPDVAVSFILDQYSNNYFISISDTNSRVYDFMATDALSVFKIQGDGEDYVAKQVKSCNSTPVIYTNTRYLLISLNPNRIEHMKNALGGTVHKQIEIDTMGGLLFYALEINICEMEDVIENSLQNEGYRLEKNESFEVLWPPCYVNGEALQCERDEAFISSSFELRAHSGNNLNVDEIIAGDNGISKVFINKIVKINRKNTELQLRQAHYSREQQFVKPTVKKCKAYRAPESMNALLFDQNGVSNLFPGQKIFMSSGRTVIVYKNNIPVEIIKGEDKDNLNDEKIKADAPLYYKCTNRSDQSI